MLPHPREVHQKYQTAIQSPQHTPAHPPLLHFPHTLQLAEVKIQKNLQFFVWICLVEMQTEVASEAVVPSGFLLKFPYNLKPKVTMAAH